MAKKLFIVTIETEVVVEAEADYEAEYVARSNIYDIIHDMEYWCREVDSVRELPDTWANSYPFGGDGDKTCQEILDPPIIDRQEKINQAQAEKTGKLFED